jgi:hypothetical protein
MQRVGRILAVEDDLAPGEHPATGDREQRSSLLVIEPGEQWPLDSHVSRA